MAGDGQGVGFRAHALGSGEDVSPVGDEVLGGGRERTRLPLLASALAAATVVASAVVAALAIGSHTTLDRTASCRTLGLACATGSLRSASARPGSPSTSGSSASRPPTAPAAAAPSAPSAPAAGRTIVDAVAAPVLSGGVAATIRPGTGTAAAGAQGATSGASVVPPTSAAPETPPGHVNVVSDGVVGTGAGDNGATAGANTGVGVSDTRRMARGEDARGNAAMRAEVRSQALFGARLAGERVAQVGARVPTVVSPDAPTAVGTLATAGGEARAAHWAPQARGTPPRDEHGGLQFGPPDPAPHGAPGPQAHDGGPPAPQDQWGPGGGGPGGPGQGGGPQGHGHH
jgi:translation initiation factor IF-2